MSNNTTVNSEGIPLVYNDTLSGGYYSLNELAKVKGYSSAKELAIINFEHTAKEILAVINSQS